MRSVVAKAASKASKTNEITDARRATTFDMNCTKVAIYPMLWLITHEMIKKTITDDNMYGRLGFDMATLRAPMIQNKNTDISENR